MANLSYGFLFKKRYIMYKDKKYEVFKFLDVVIGIKFINADNREVCNITSGNYTGETAHVISKSENEGELIFINQSLNDTIRKNDMGVDFVNIRSNVIESMNNLDTKYFMRSSSEIGLTLINDKNLIDFLKNNEETEYNEEIFKKKTDISSMYTSIKKTIVSQDEQIMKILTTLFKNQKIVNSDLDPDLITKLKENILIYGSTGTGKTEILKRISKIYNIPIVIEDATSLSETGYHGRNVTDMLEDLYQAAGRNKDAAEKGILVIDEFDKLVEKENDNTSHVSRIGVQRSLLKLLDGSTFYFNNSQFNTSKLTIVGIGAFTEITNNDDYKNLTTDDFMKYGIMRELIGRFSKTIAMNKLTKEDIIKILKYSDFSPLNTYQKLFELLQVEFDFTDDFINYIACLAIEKKSGARSLKTVFDECISSALFKIFAGEYSGISLVKPNNIDEVPYILKRNKEH